MGRTVSLFMYSGRLGVCPDITRPTVDVRRNVPRQSKSTGSPSSDVSPLFAHHPRSGLGTTAGRPCPSRYPEQGYVGRKAQMFERFERGGGRATRECDP